VLTSYKSKISEISYSNAQMESELHALRDYEEANARLSEHNEELTTINSEMKLRLEE